MYLGQPVNSQIGARAPRVGQEDGRWVEYQVFKGSANTDLPGTFAVTDILTGEVLRSIKLPTAEACFDLTVATDGKVYLPSYYDYRLRQYDPVTKQVNDLGPINDDATRDHTFGAGFGPDGIVFLGTYSESRLHRFDPATGVITNLGTVDPDEEYIHFVCWDPGSNAVFCATGGKQGSVWRIEDLGSGARTRIIGPDNFPELAGKTFLGMLDCVNGHLVARVGTVFVVTDLHGQIEYHTGTEGELAGWHVVPARDGSGFFFSQSGTIRKYDFGSRSHAAVAGTVRSYICHGVEIEGNVIVGSDADGPFTVNHVTRERTEQNVSFRQPTLIQKIFPGPGDTMYASGYMVGLAQINTDGGEPNHTVNLGQFESWMVREGKIYLAGYGFSKFYSYDPAQPTVLPKQLFTSAPQHLDRPFAMSYNQERDEVYIGSVPEYGHYQGGLAIYDFATGKPTFLTSEIAVDQGIVSAAWNPHDGLLHLGTTIDGGMGNDPISVTTEGQLVVLDPVTRTVVRRTVPVAGRQGVTGLLVDPDGSVWAVAEEQLIKVAPDGTVQVCGAVSNRYAKDPNYTWAWAYLNWSARDGKIYGTAGGNLFRIDPATGAITRLADSGASWAATDPAGDVYFSYRTHCFKYLVPQPITGVNEAQKCLAVQAAREGRAIDTSSLDRGEQTMYAKLVERVRGGRGDELERAYCRR